MTALRSAVCNVPSQTASAAAATGRAGTPQSAGSSASTPASAGIMLAERLHQGGWVGGWVGVGERLDG